MRKEEKNPREAKWELHSYRISSRRPLDDGEVVLGAAEWKEFRDPESLVSLESSDLERLGIAKYQTRQEILDCLGKVLVGKTIPELPVFSKKFREASLSRKTVVSLEEWKNSDLCARARKRLGGAERAEREALSLAMRRAIMQVVFFCEIPSEPEDAQAKPEPKADSWIGRAWHWISGKKG